MERKHLFALLAVLITFFLLLGGYTVDDRSQQVKVVSVLENKEEPGRKSVEVQILPTGRSINIERNNLTPDSKDVWSHLKVGDALVLHRRWVGWSMFGKNWQWLLRDELIE